MSNQLISFSFREKHNVHIQVINGAPWFCLKNICEILDIKNASQLSSQLDEKGICKTYTPTKGGRQQLTFVSEPNLYRVIFRSNKPEAKQFQDWIFNEVLPSIRKTGRYEQPIPASPAQAPELFRSSDIDNLSSMIQSMSNGFRFERSWSNAIWYALRREVGVPSPRRFEVWQIPLLAEACQRLFIITDRLKAMTLTAERQMVRRVLRNREDAEAVLTEMQQLMDKDICQKHTLRAEALEKWQHVSLATFLYRH